MASAFPFAVSLDLAQHTITEAGSSAFSSALDAAERALAHLLAASPMLELFTSVERSDDVLAARAVADALKANTSVIVVLGIGGSSLGGQALKDLAPPAKPDVFF